MQTIKELLNQIKWDKSKKPEEYTVLYEEKKENKLEEIRYLEIKKIEGNFMTIEKDSEEVEIPLHLVREVRRTGKLVWRRTSAV